MANVKKTRRKTIKWALGLLAAPFLTLLVLAVLLYIPPIQRFVLDKVTASLSETTGIEIHAEKVRLSFPLDLSVHRVSAIEEGDTLVYARTLHLNIRFLPLLRGRADVDGLSLSDLSLDTRDWLPDVHLRGQASELSATIKGVEWNAEKIRVNEIALRKSQWLVALSDTAAADTTESTSQWKILTDKISIESTDIALSFPGDSLRIIAGIGNVSLDGGLFDTGASSYGANGFSILNSRLTYAARDSFNDGRNGNTAWLSSNRPLWDGFIAPAHPSPNYVAINGLSLQSDSLHFCSIRDFHAKVSHLAFGTADGWQLDNLKVSVSSDKENLNVEGFNLTTPHSALTLGISLPWRSLEEKQTDIAGLTLAGQIGKGDVRNLLNLSGMADLAERWPQTPIELYTRLSGNLQSVNIDTLTLGWPRMVELTARATIDRPTNLDREGKARFSLKTGNLSFFNNWMFPDSSLTIPNGMRIDGNAEFGKGQYQAKVNSHLREGRLLARVSADENTKGYRCHLQSKDFPLTEFLPQSGLGNLTAQVQATGRGFDLLSRHTLLDGDASVKSFTFGEMTFDSLHIGAKLAKGVGILDFASFGDLLEGQGQLRARTGQDIAMELDATLPHINLHRLAQTKDTLYAGTQVSMQGHVVPDLSSYGVKGRLYGNLFHSPVKSIMAKDLEWDFSAEADTTSLTISAGDLNLALEAGGTIEKTTEGLENFFELLGKQLQEKAFDQYILKDELPVLNFSMQAGTDNPMSNILRHLGYTFDQWALKISTHPMQGLSGNMDMLTFKSGNLQFDDIRFVMSQDNNGVSLDGQIRNHSKRNPNKFDANLRAYLLNSGGGLEVKFVNDKGQTGIDVGLRAKIGNGAMDVSIYPSHPIFAFREFTINEDNYINIDKQQLLRADVSLNADDGTGILFYAEPNDSANDITLSLHQLNLKELSEVLPYVPQLKGLLSGDIHLLDKNSLSAMAIFNAEGLAYEDVPLGNVGIEAIYLPKEDGAHYANAYISSNDSEVMAVEGSFYSQNGEFEGKAQLLDFPLPLLNGFLAGSDLALQGNTGGHLDIRGSEAKMDMNGELRFNQAHVVSDVYGFDFRLDESPVSIRNGKMVFKDFGLHSKQSDNPLLLNGQLDMSDLADMQMDFNMKATNFELINTKRKKQSLLYGKVYADYIGTIKGGLDDLSIRGKVSILDRTDMTYILKDSPLTVDDRLHDLVQFVSFTDSLPVEAKTTPVSNFEMTLGISVNDAAQFHCDLSEDGENYIDIEGGGDLTMRMTRQGDLRLTGRFVANSGEMKYSLPIIPLKTFKLKQGSYVDFTGDVTNPTLNITATERLKATVTENDVPRTVAFDVGVNITQPLNKMGLEFIIDAPEDLGMQNQLASMTSAQRGKSAVAMLATGMYLNDEGLSSGGSGFKASNALNAFLQSEIQNIAGSALRTIDVSIGMESGTSDAGTSTTDYSFQFAKRFLNNRISVIVGGKVSTGADAENSAESFIDNVSVEYRLDKSASRYVRVFYDRGTNDPFEGQLMTTGAGLVLRRKTNRLGELFIFKNSDKSVSNKKNSKK